jgi:AcrR family transcriptional regulator
MPELSSGTDRRARQAAARLEQILDAAARLFAERGFHRTTTRDIADAADIAEGTLYNYFTNKNDLLFGILARLEARSDAHRQVETDHQRECTPDGNLDDPQRFFAGLLFERRDFVENNAVMLQAVLAEILSNTDLRRRYTEQLLAPTIAALEANLALRQEIGQLRPIDGPALARLLTAQWIGLFVLQVVGDPLVHDQWDRLVDAFGDSLYNGVAPRA